MSKNNIDALIQKYFIARGFPGGSDGEASACSAGDPGLITGLGRSPGEGKGYPLQYYGLLLLLLLSRFSHV